jgi:hypothetical protein
MSSGDERPRLWESLVQVVWSADWSIVESWPGGRPGGWWSESSRIEFVDERLELGSVQTYKLLF